MSAACPLSDVLGGLSVTSLDTLDWRSVTVRGASLDGRHLQPGELYLALPGGGSHGLTHVAQALDAGASAVVSVPGGFTEHREAARLVASRGVPALEIVGLTEVVGTVGDRCFGSPDKAMRMIGVTGTDGKTSVCRFIAEALAAGGEPAGYIGTLGWGLAGKGRDELQASALTTPDALTLRRMLRHMLDAGARSVAFEASSHGLVQGRLHGLSIDMAVLTNLGRDHLDYHGDMARYAEAKAALFDWPTLQARIINGDDVLGRALVSRGKGSITTFSIRTQAAVTEAPDPAPHALRASRIRTTVQGLRFVMTESGAHGSSTSAEVVSRLFGRFNVQNLLACAGVLRRAGLAFERVGELVSQLEPVAGRMQRVAAGRIDAPTVIVDFAHTPGALTAAVAAVRDHCPGQLCVVFGCGGDRDPGKRAPMARAAATADRVIVTDDNPRSEPSRHIIDMVLLGFKDRARVRVVPDRASAIETAVNEAAPDDVVLIAGKGHERYQLVAGRRLPFSDVDVAARLLAGASPSPIAPHGALGA